MTTEAGTGQASTGAAVQEGAGSGAAGEGTAPNAAGAEGTPGTTTPAAEGDYEFTAPDGIDLDEASTTEFKAILKDAKIGKEGAQKILDLAVKREQARVEAHANLVKTWTDQVKADKELGGEKLDENLAVAKKTFSLLKTEDAQQLKDMLNSTGLNAHPAMFRLFHAVGKLLSEDKHVPANQPAAAQTSMADRLYGGQKAATT